LLPDSDAGRRRPVRSGRWLDSSRTKTAGRAPRCPPRRI